MLKVDDVFSFLSYFSYRTLYQYAYWENIYGKRYKIPISCLVKCCLSGLQFTKANREKTLIRLLLQKQSDLGLHCLSTFFSQLVLEHFRY